MISIFSSLAAYHNSDIAHVASYYKLINLPQVGIYLSVKLHQPLSLPSVFLSLQAAFRQHLITSWPGKRFKK